MPEKFVIAVDAMGGDNAPGAVCEGAIEAVREFPDILVQLYGAEGALREKLGGVIPERIQIIHAPDVIGMHEAPMLAVRHKTDSSLVKAVLAVKGGEAQAVVSAGSTGALLACGMIRAGRIRGVERPALLTVLPGRKKPFVLIDSGANVDSQPKYLLNFGLMGAIYARQVLKIENPTVGLLNIGSEEEKGNQLTRQAYALMREQSVYDFIGNVEAREVPNGGADVVVADGFDGNVLLKYTEGLAGALMGMLKDQMSAGLRNKLGALLLMPALRNFKRSTDYEEYGGAPLLGVEGALIKAHGSSGARAFKNAIRQARAMAEGNVVGIIRSGVERLTSDASKEGGTA